MGSYEKDVAALATRLFREKNLLEEDEKVEFVMVKDMDDEEKKKRLDLVFETLRRFIEEFAGEQKIQARIVKDVAGPDGEAGVS